VEAAPDSLQGGGRVRRLAQDHYGPSLVLAEHAGAPEPGVVLGDEDAVAGEEGADQVPAPDAAVEVRLHRAADHPYRGEDERDDEVGDREGLGVAAHLAPEPPLPRRRLGRRPRGGPGPGSRRFRRRAGLGHDGTGYRVAAHVRVCRRSHRTWLPIPYHLRYGGR